MGWNLTFQKKPDSLNSQVFYLYLRKSCIKKKDKLSIDKSISLDYSSYISKENKGFTKMTQLYTPKFLIKKGLPYCKQVAKELGVVPTEGDKRELFTWVNAIIEFQESKIAKVEEVQKVATIERDDRDRYVITVNGEEFGSFTTLRQAEYAVSRQENWILETVEVETVEVEPVAVEPVAVEPVVETVEVIEPVAVEPVVETVETVVEADERGSGRLKEFLYIKNAGYTCEHGWVYELKFQSSRQVIGEMYLNLSRGYTLDGEKFYESWTDPAEILLADYYLLEEFR